MHSVLFFEGWTIRYLSGNSEEIKKPNSTPLDGRSTAEAESFRNPQDLEGVAISTYEKEDGRHIASIRYDEVLHNLTVIVEGAVYHNSSHEEEAIFKKRRRFSGPECKKEASQYAEGLRMSIERDYFNPNSIETEDRMTQLLARRMGEIQ